ncbi:MAG: hypothetical protein JXN64_06190 [Spirochaetes bacterium]|nr:hypothetical protein [Spirochaetota bacterium]
MFGKDADLALITDLENIKESIIGSEIQADRYFKAVQRSRVPDIDEILKDKERYKAIIDIKGEIEARYLQASILVLSGKTGDNYFKLGRTYSYFKEHKKWAELGFNNEKEFIESSPYGENYFYKAEQIYKLVLHGRLKREDVIELGNKTTLLSAYIIESLNSNEIMKLVKKMKTLTYEQCVKFVRGGEYESYLAGGTELKEIPLVKKGKTWEHIQVNFNFPKFKVTRDKLEQKFETDWEAQVYALALRKVKPIIEREIESIFNDPSYEKYRKLALKKYKK